MDRFLKFVGLITIIILIICGANWLIQHFPKYAKPTLQVLGIIALIAIFIRLYLGKDWLMKIGNEFVIGSDLIKASENFLNDLPKPKNETSANLIGHLVYRFTRLGLIGLVIASIPIILLYKQNQKIDTQNELITKQNKRLDQQTYLQEAERRSSLVFLFSNIMDAIDEELKNDVGIKGKRDLSPQLIGRIIALSQSLKPYHYMDGDSLINKPLSPERGQLLISLINSNLDDNTFEKIILKSDFSFADLKNVELKGINLRSAKLSNSDLSYANLEDAIMREIELTGARLEAATLSNSDLRYANMNGANLSKSKIENADMRNIFMENADLSGANLKGTNLSSNSRIWGGPQVLFNKMYTMLNDSDLIGANLVDVNLTNVNLHNSDLSKADIRNTIFKNAFLRNVKIDSAIVNPDFLQKIQDSDSENSKFFENYEIDFHVRNIKIVDDKGNETGHKTDTIYFLKQKEKFK